MYKRLAGAVDIGGTKILCGIVDSSGKVYSKQVFPTYTGTDGNKISCMKILDSIRNQAVKNNIKWNDLTGIGVVCAGPLDSVKGIVKNPYTLPGWENFELVKFLSELSGKKVYIENDVNGALLGEVQLRGLDSERVLLIAFGTGIGVAVCERGVVYRAGKHYHAEMGHIIVDCDGPECYCNHRGCFESYWSGNAINSNAVREGYVDFDHLYESYQKNDAKAVRFIERSKRQFQNGIWNLMTLFKPDVLILGGGLMRRYYDFAEGIIMKDLSNSYDFVEEFRILPASSIAESGLVGAGGLVFDSLSKSVERGCKNVFAD